MQYLPLYSPEQARRHHVKPGFMAGHRSTVVMQFAEEKFRLDVWYVDHRPYGLICELCL